MKTICATLICLATAAPAFAQGGSAPAAASPASGFSGLFTAWSGTSRESMQAEAGRRAAEAAAAAQSGAIPAGVPLRSRSEAVALGERVGEVVRAGDCQEGERIAREAGDFALVRAVRDHCRAGSPS